MALRPVQLRLRLHWKCPSCKTEHSLPADTVPPSGEEMEQLESEVDQSDVEEDCEFEGGIGIFRPDYVECEKCKKEFRTLLPGGFEGRSSEGGDPKRV